MIAPLLAFSLVGLAGSAIDHYTFEIPLVVFRSCTMEHEEFIH